MNSTQYLLTELNIFITVFPKTRVRYEYDSLAKVHIVEVVPNQIYHLDGKYIQWESSLFDKFIREFPNENICFISDDAIVGIEIASSTLYGEEYTAVTTNKEALEVGSNTVNNKQLPSSYLYPEITFTEVVFNKDSQARFEITTGINQTICSNNNLYPLAA